MGALWNILQPVALIIILSVVFTRIMSRGSAADIPYPVYLCSGLLPWIAFADVLSRGTHCFVSHAGYLRKLPIPEQVFIAQTVVATSIGLAISFGLLMILSAALGHTPTWHWLLLPAPLGLFLTMGFGIALGLGTLFAFIRDIGQVVPIIVQIGFWAYPICYTIDILPEWMRDVIPWNPVAPYIDATRALFLDARVPDPSTWALMLAWAVATSAGGYAILRKLRPELRDVL